MTTVSSKAKTNEPRIVVMQDRHAPEDSREFKVVEAYNTLLHDIGSWIGRSQVQQLIDDGIKVTIKEYRRT